MAELNAIDKVEAARQLTEFVLRAEEVFSECRRKKAKEIYQIASERNMFSNIRDVFPTPDSLGPYISFAIAGENSVIVKPNGKQGYYISQAQQQIKKREETGDVPRPFDERTEREKEKTLYPVIERWLQNQGYRTKVTVCTKQTGKWGSPSVSGIKITDFIGSKEIEITTAVAKTTIDNWEYNIFESVSHRRFSNRAYFAFAHPFSLIGSLPANLRHYCELYQVGLLIITMDDSLYENYIKGEVLENEDFDITEVYAAPYNHVQTKWQKEFCHTVGIKDNENLYTWGNVFAAN